jgi:hypothetical protein
LHVPHDLLPRGTAEERIAIVGHRTRQADALARSSLLRVLEDDALFSQFRTDAQIEAFWDLPDHERLIRWGPGLNITTLT